MTGNADYSELFLVPTTVVAIFTVLMLYKAGNIDWSVIGAGMVLGVWMAVGVGCALSFLRWSWERSVQCEVEKRLKEKEMEEEK